MAKPDPLNGKLIVITGGSGFLGNYVAQALLQRGARLRIASRNPKHAFSLKPLANLGQMQFAYCDVTNQQHVDAMVQGADAVVNLAGSFDGDLVDLMGNAPGNLAAAAKSAGARAFVHISAIGADAESEESTYARAKGIGENRVLAEFPKATIVRPSVLFGKDDNFLNMFAGLIQLMPVLPVFGPDAELQPAYVDDCAEAIAVALADPGRYGCKTYELGGPEVLTMLDINQRIADGQRRSRTFIPMPDFASGIFAAMPLTPMSRDQWTMLRSGSVVAEGAKSFKQLGIEPKPLGLFLDKWMKRFRKHGRFTVEAKA